MTLEISTAGLSLRKWLRTDTGKGESFNQCSWENWLFTGYLHEEE